MPTCREVVRLLATGVGTSDWTVRALLLRLHLLLCGDCRRYAREIAALGPMIRETRTEPLDAERLAVLERAILSHRGDDRPV